MHDEVLVNKFKEEHKIYKKLLEQSKLFKERLKEVKRVKKLRIEKKYRLIPKCPYIKGEIEQNKC